MILALLFVPTVAGAAAFFLRADRPRRALLVATAAVHAALTGAVVAKPALAEPIEGWLVLDGAGLLFLAITSALFLAASVYGVGYLARESKGRREDFEEGMLFDNVPEAVFTGCLLVFLATMTLVTVSQHLGLLWVGIEATTLFSAPLIYFHRHHRSLEATWKYLLICSVGIALALLGNFLLAVAATPHGGGTPLPLVLRDLLAGGPQLRVPWLRAAFLCLIVGYGTKMGLAPLHTWLPDAHSEAPSVVSALLSGALLNCAFLGILRALQICGAAGEAAFGREVLVVLGLLSMGLAGAFILGQADYKRMLAYSSVEHMGILALGVGLGGAAVSGALYHAVNHSLAKGMLFLAAGNIVTAYHTKAVREVRGVSRVLPITAGLWLAGFLAITGSPPFGAFLSEFAILKGALDQGRWVVSALYLSFLGLAFVGMAGTVLRMAQGMPATALPEAREPAVSLVPPLVLGAAVLVLGLYVPPALGRLFHDVGLAMGGTG